MKKFSTSLDDTAYKLSYGIIALCTVIGMSTWYTYQHKNSGHVSTSFILCTPFLLAGLVVAMYILKPLSLDVTDSSITIDRKAMPVTIPFSQIKGVSIVPEGDMGFAIRTFGNGGLYGFTGYYYNKKMGSMLWYCTRRANYVLIEKTNGKKIIVTPDDADAFVAFAHQQHPEMQNA